MATFPSSAPSSPSVQLITLSQASQNALLDYCKKTTEFSFNTWNLRDRLAQIDREYYRENLQTPEGVLGKAVNMAGNKKKLADIVVPIVEPQIETALAYLTSLFLTGQPIFGCTGSPADIKQAKTIEAIIDDEARHGGWVRQFIMFFRDGLKYNFHCMETAWQLEKTYQPFSQVSQRGLNVEQREIIWQGNVAKRIDPYNVLFDMRVQPADMHKYGEFSGYVELMSRIRLKEFVQNLSTRMNVKEAMEAPLGAIYRYYIPEINWDSLVKTNISRGMDWMAWALAQPQGDSINYKNIYEVCTRYCRIIPNDFQINVPAKNTPQIWKLITVNDSVLVFAEKQTNAHNYLPMIFGQPIEDGLGYQTKSQAARLIPIQDTASVLWNLRLAAKRRSISDRGLYNPLLVREEDINSDNPSAKIPVRPTGYGKPLQEAYYPIPYEDRDSSSFVSDAREMQQFANFVSGQNQAQQGQFVKGNKTQSEYEDVMNNSSGRQKMMGQFIHAQVMIPFLEILKINILQYMPAGQVYSTADKTSYEVDPVALRQAAIGFKMADGLLPEDKIIGEDTLQVAVQSMFASPILAQTFDVAGAFAYMMAGKGLDLTPFLRQPQQIPQGAPAIQGAAQQAIQAGTSPMVPGAAPTPAPTTLTAPR